MHKYAYAYTYVFMHVRMHVYGCGCILIFVHRLTFLRVGNGFDNGVSIYRFKPPLACARGMPQTPRPSVGKLEQTELLGSPDEQARQVQTKDGTTESRRRGGVVLQGCQKPTGQAHQHTPEEPKPRAPGKG